MVAILARNKAHVLPSFLNCIEKLDYDKKLITIYINTNNNVDGTEQLLKDWAKKNQSLYRDIVFEEHQVEGMPNTKPHEWTPERWKILGAIRNKSLKKNKRAGLRLLFCCGLR